MNYGIEIGHRAQNELQESAVFYELQSQGLGDRFLNAVYDTFEKIDANPEAFPIERNFRKASVRHFPFLVLYRIQAESLVILSVFHNKRNPKTKPR
ncbi:MAG: type II toxin-antitoxin system RelE/ParE family toxin [Leeuwenhoekiella sp.]